MLRLNLGQMDAFSSAASVARRYLGRVGKMFDPHRIIAPGRYQPDPD